MERRRFLQLRTSNRIRTSDPSSTTATTDTPASIPARSKSKSAFPRLLSHVVLHLGEIDDQASDDATATGVTFYNRRLEKGRSNYDVNHRWVTYALWELPFGRGRKWMRDSNWLVNGALGGWELNVIQTLEQGIPFNWGFTCATNVFLPGTQRPHMAPGKTYDDIKIPWDAKGPCRHQLSCALPWADVNAFAYKAVRNFGSRLIDQPEGIAHPFAWTLCNSLCNSEDAVNSLWY